MTRQELIDAIVQEVMDDRYGSSALSGSPISSGAKKLGSMAKKGKDKIKKEVNHEIVTPVRSLQRAVKYKIEAGKVKRSGNLVRAKTMNRRANAVFANRGAVLAAATVGAGVGVLAPMPGSAETGSVLAAKGASRTMKGLRARRLRRAMAQ